MVEMPRFFQKKSGNIWNITVFTRCISFFDFSLKMRYNPVFNTYNRAKWRNPLNLQGLRLLYFVYKCCMEQLLRNFFYFFIQFFWLIVFFVQPKVKNRI